MLTRTRGSKTRTFDFASIYHATNTKSFQGTGVVGILFIKHITSHNFNNVILQSYTLYSSCLMVMLLGHKTRSHYCKQRQFLVM